MKVISSYKVSYVVPETAEEKAEIDKIITEVGKEKLGIDFQMSDLKLVDPRQMLVKGAWVKEDL